MPTRESEKLKQCPFCGGEATTTREFWEGAAPAGSTFANAVGCPDCDVWIERETEEEAIEVWNIRATGGTCEKVYLVETSDELIESWLPFAVYLHREAAEDCAEALRKYEDGVLCFARVSELKVVDE